VRVDFTLVEPVAGVSVTSPGFTGQAPPCTIDVQPQPGDALSCIKYVHSLQGTTITIRARVMTPAGGTIEDTRTVVLPDMRPPDTPTNTVAPSATLTGTPTPAAAHLQIALFVDQASDNRDGTLSSVISALVTDDTGAAIGNGVAVQFRLEPPVP